MNRNVNRHPAYDLFNENWRFRAVGCNLARSAFSIYPWTRS